MMFDALFDAMFAWNQILLIFGGLVCLGIGVLLYGYTAGRRLSCVWAQGKIVDVRATGIKDDGTGKKFTGEMYYPVFEYKAPDGTTRRNEDGGGSNWILGAIPGTEVKLLLDPKDAENIYRPSFVMPLIGLMFAAPGAGMLYVAFTHFEFNIFTLLLLLGGAAYIFLKIKKGIKPREQWEKKESFRARMNEKNSKKRAEGRVLTAQEVRDRVRVYDRYARIYMLVMGVTAAGLIYLGIHLGQGMQSFLARAAQAPGEVVRLESSRDNEGDTTYYPHVAFTTAGGGQFEFRDSVGSNPAMYRTGDRVDVLYDPANPRQAIIDRGFWNWAASGGSFAGGLALLWGCLRLSLGARNRGRL